MKHIALAVALVGCTPAHAEQDTCVLIGQLSAVIMEGRQENIPLATAIEHAEGHQMVVNIILEAYESPQYWSPEHKQRAAVQFANRKGVECYRGTLR